MLASVPKGGMIATGMFSCDLKYACVALCIMCERVSCWQHLTSCRQSGRGGRRAAAGSG